MSKAYDFGYDLFKREPELITREVTFGRLRRDAAVRCLLLRR
jgi:hypothetical protein